MTKRAHEKVPLQAYLRIAWFCFCVFVTGIWTKVYFDDYLQAKQCFVKENDDGTFELVEHVEAGLLKNDNITNVSSRFEYLSVSYLAQGVLSLISIAYQLMAIYCISSLLMYRHYISRINKLFLLYGAYILIMTFIYRLDEAGKICSGDYLTDSEKNDPLIAKNYLIETGRLYWAYMCGIWAISILAVICGIVIGYQVYTTFT